MTEAQALSPFVQCFENAAEATNLNPLQRLRVRFWLVAPRTRQHIEQAVTLELAFAEVATVGANRLIDWDNFDPDKFDRFIEALLKFIEGLSKFFA